MRKIKLELDLENEEYLDLLNIYDAKNKIDLKDKLEGALNNWILEMLLDQDEWDFRGNHE